MGNLSDRCQKQKAIVIGSGIGGLSTAIILTKLGIDVTVIEKNRHPGGMLRSYVRQGMHCNVGLHYLGALDKGQILRRLFDYLGITEKLTLEPLGINAPVDRYYFSDTGVGPLRFDMPVGLDTYENNLKKTFPEEIQAIENFMALLRRSAAELDRLDFLFGNPKATDLIDQMEPLWQVLDRLTCSPILKSVLSVPSVWFGVPPHQCPQFLHTMTLASYLASSWRLKNHGTEMVNALVQRLLELGGRVVCGQTVDRINVHNGKVAGVTMKNGEHQEASLIVGAVHPGVVLEMLGPQNVKPSYRRRIQGLVNTRGMFSVNAILPANTHTPRPYNIFKLITDSTGNICDAIYAQLRATDQPERLLLSLVTHGHEDHWQQWEQTDSGRRGPGYEKAKQTLAKTLIKKMEPVLGPLDEAEVIDTYTPLSIRDWVNSPQGSAYGVMRSEQQMLSAALLNRAPIKGLYLAGQSVMAPGILGTIIGSLVTAKFIVGPECFLKQVHL